MPLTIPNILTLTRLLLIPVFVLCFYLPFEWSSFLTALFFFIAGLTDWLDGYLARTLGQTSKLGAFLDPVADKIMVAIALVLIAERYHVWWVTIPAATMIAREVIISALREWMAELGKRTNVAVSTIGKWKTAFQMMAVCFLFWHPLFWMEYIAFVGLYIAMILTFWSMFKYLLAAKSEFLDPNNH